MSLFLHTEFRFFSTPFFSRKTDTQKQPLRPHLIVKEALKMLHATLPTTIYIDDDIDEDCGTILADPTNIHQITLNLCTNALHAMVDEKGTVNISLHRREISAADIPPGKDISAGLFIVLTVRDTGTGMDKDTLDHIFEPFFTTKELGHGTGMGLSVIHGIVEGCKGFIKVESTVGKGSTFTVYLPALAETAAEPAVRGQGDKAAATSCNERILVVDDDPLLVRINESRLKNQGYQVTAISDSMEALEEFRSQPDSFDMLITDQTMPGLTGTELAKAVLDIKPSIPVILCTGHSEIVTEDKALSMGIKKYVLKPIHGDELLDAVREVLDKK
jgi:two-component system, cell cycle sensor histidine kinase and response regulator CckA